MHTSNAPVMRKNLGTVVAKVKEIKSPIMGTFRGYRLVAAHDNLAARCFGKACPSFEKPYRVYMRGDFMQLTCDHIKGFTEILKQMGASKVTWVE